MFLKYMQPDRYESCKCNELFRSREFYLFLFGIFIFACGSAFAQVEDYLDYEEVVEMHRAAYKEIRSASITQIIDREEPPLTRQTFIYDRESMRAVYLEEPANPEDFVDNTKLNAGETFTNFDVRTTRLFDNGRWIMYLEGVKRAHFYTVRYEDLTSVSIPPFQGLITKYYLEEDIGSVTSNMMIEDGKDVVVYDITMMFGSHLRVKCDPDSSYKVLELEKTYSGVPRVKHVAKNYRLFDGVYYPETYIYISYNEGIINHMHTESLLAAEFNRDIPEDVFQSSIPEDIEIVESPMESSRSSNRETIEDTD